jgi:small subunit ribosomal protein S4
MKLKLTAKISRREGIAVSERAAHIRALQKRAYPPGVHGPDGFRRTTDYGKQLREKQKAKRMYGLNERQFTNLFKEAVAKRGNSSETMIQMLERRLDNAIFRAGFAKTRSAARQAVSHAHFDVNGKKVNVPSYRLSPGDVVTVRESKKGKGLWKNGEESVMKKEAPSWLAVDAKHLTIKIASVPTGQDLVQPFDAKQIIEFYSRQ